MPHYRSTLIRIAQGEFPNATVSEVTAANKLPVPAGKKLVINEVRIINISGAVRSVKFFVVPDGESQGDEHVVLARDFAGSVPYVPFDESGNAIVMESLDKLYARGSGAGVYYYLSGVLIEEV